MKLPSMLTCAWFDGGHINPPMKRPNVAAEVEACRIHGDGRVLLKVTRRIVKGVFVQTPFK